MRSRDDNTIRFLRRVRRRLMLMRVAERGGACASIASIFACAFASLALWTGRDAMQFVVPIIALGAGVGIAWGLSRLPTPFEAAVEADRQLRLCDLLATAYAQRQGDDPWQRSILAIANKRCRALSPSAVVVHRYGGRAWGGIGLAAALALTLGLLSSVPRDTLARHGETARSQKSERPSAEADVASMMSSAISQPRELNSTEPDSRTATGLTGVEFNHAEPPRDATSNADFTRPGNDAGGGDKPGQTTLSDGAMPRAAGDGRESSHGDVATGGRTAAGSNEAGGGPAGSLAGSNASSGTQDARNTPSWSGSSWEADRAAAGEAVRSGRVPDRYRDVVGEYFREGNAASP